MSSIRIRGITKSFGKTRVLEGIDLDVAQGEVVTLLGPSGCGKSTLIRIVAGLDRADAGELSLGDRVVDAGAVFVPPEARRLGMVFQSYAVWPHKTVAANVAYPLRLRGDTAADEKVRRALELVHLAGLEGRYPHELSGGQQQRVALARALVAEPEVLLLDEPLSNLDARLREEMRGELSEISRRLGVTVLLVTHDQGEALAIADRVAVMRSGRIAQLGAPEALYRRPASRYVAEALGPVCLLPLLRLEPAGSALRAVTRAGITAELEPIEGATVEGHLLCVRPEAWRLGAGGPSFIVRSSTFMGERRELVLEGEGLELRALAPAGSPHRAGDRVELSVERGAATLVPAG